MRLLAPLDGVLRAGRRYGFALRAPGALAVAVESGGRWTRLAGHGEAFAGEVAVAPGPVTVYAQYGSSAEFEGLLRYDGR